MFGDIHTALCFIFHTLTHFLFLYIYYIINSILISTIYEINLSFCCCFQQRLIMKGCIGRFFVSHIYQNLQNRWHILFRDARTVILSYPQPFISHLINRRLPVCILFGSFSNFSFIYKYII